MGRGVCLGWQTTLIAERKVEIIESVWDRRAIAALVCASWSTSEGALVFQHARKMGLEGIVSKRLGSRRWSGRSPDWLKFKNPEAPAVKREAEEGLGQMTRALVSGCC